MTSLVGLKARQDLEVAVPGDPGLDRLELRGVVPDDEHPFELLAFLARLELGGRPGRPSSTRLAGRDRFAHDGALLVDDDLTHRGRLDRHGDHALPRGRGDLRRAGEPRTHVGDLLVEREHDLEVGRHGRGGLTGGLDRAVADLGDLRGERAARHRVDGDLGLLPELDGGDVGLVHLDLGLDDRHVRHREQHRAGVVHRPGHRGFPFFDIAAGHDAGDR